MFRDTAPALQLRGLTKRYDDGTLALENFDLEIPAGSFFGLLGPNGAGKTTAISAVCNLIRVTSGEVLVFGEPADTLEARSSRWWRRSWTSRGGCGGWGVWGAPGAPHVD